MTETDLQTLNDIDYFLLENPQFDEHISIILTESGYLEIWKSDYEANPWRYDGDFFINSDPEYWDKDLKEFRSNYGSLRTIDELKISIAESELNKFTSDQPSLNDSMRFAVSINRYKEFNANYPRKYFEILIALYQQLLKNCYMNINSANKLLTYYNYDTE